MKGTMKAAVFKDIEKIILEDLPIPDCPADGIQLNIHACGICGSDVRNYHNGLKDGIKNQIPGHEIAGEIIEVGKNTTRYEIGDRVALAPDVSCGSCWFCKHGLVNLCLNHKMLGTHYPGGYAQYMAVPGEVLTNGFIELIPEDMSYEHAAFAETAAAVVACQKRINVSLGDRVLIIGDGPVGCLHAEIAKAHGASLVMMAGMDRLTLAKKMGCELLLDNREPSKVKEKVMEATNGLGADIVICAVPTIYVQQQALELCRKRGTVVIYGGVPKSNEMSPLNSNLIHYNELTVTGSFSYPAIGLSDALDAIYHKHIHAEYYINKFVPLDKIKEGIETIEAGEALKVIISPWIQ